MPTWSNPYNLDFGNMMGAFTAGFFVTLIWSLAWKGVTLWVTARRGQTVWFVLFLIINTFGIGEIIYLLATNGFKELKKK